MSGIIWTEKQIEILKEVYSDINTKDVARLVGRSEHSVFNKANKLGLKKSEAFFNSELSGRKDLSKYPEAIQHRFPKGHNPWNKDLKGIQIGGVESQFKKGNEPYNTKHDGAISIRRDNEGRPYKHIRVSKAKWVLLHRYTWQSVNGEIPKGYNVQFKDGDTMNCDIDNLELVSKSENMQRNSYVNYPENLRKTIHLRGVLNRQINKQLEYEHNNQEQ